MLPSITFAIPFYANLRYLRRAIESVLRQTDGDWKLIVCDDGADQAQTRRVVAEFEDARIRYHPNECRLGMAGNWNRCLDLADTELVTLLHGDDELLPNYTATMRREAHRHPDAVALFCDAEIIDGDGQQRFSLPDHVKRMLKPSTENTLQLCGRQGVKALLRGNFVVCPTLGYRRAILKDRRFSDRWRFIQDLDLLTRLLLDGDTIIGVNQVGYRYRRHGANATDMYTRDLVRFREELAFYAALDQQAAERGWSDVARVARRKTMVKLNLGWCVLQDICRLRPRQCFDKIRLLVRLGAQQQQLLGTAD
jgi:glycosyltransferase involved in cell wall biosynthesis